MTDRQEHPAASGRYVGAWIGWCERCGKHRLRIYRWVEDNGLAGDTVCWRCRRFKSGGRRTRRWRGHGVPLVYVSGHVALHLFRFKFPPDWWWRRYCRRGTCATTERS